MARTIRRIPPKMLLPWNSVSPENELRYLEWIGKNIRTDKCARKLSMDHPFDYGREVWGAGEKRYIKRQVSRTRRRESKRTIVKEMKELLLFDYDTDLRYY